MKPPNSQTQSDEITEKAVVTSSAPRGTRFAGILFNIVMPLAYVFIILAVVLMKFGLLPETFEQSTSMQILGIFGIVLPLFYILHWAAFTQMESNLRYLARALLLFLDGLILVVLSAAAIVWIRS